LLLKDIIGYNDIKDQFITAYKFNKLHHAHLLMDQPQGASLPLVIAFAQYINCQQPIDNDSCNLCSSCLKYNKLAHPDLHFSFPYQIDKKNNIELCQDLYPSWKNQFESNQYFSDLDWINTIELNNSQGKITAIECKEIVRKIHLHNFEAKYKVFIIWQIERAEEEANILLKSLEEPSENTIFFLISLNHDFVLTTILSRCQTWRIPPLKLEDANKICMNRGLQYDNNELARIWQDSEGIIGKLIQLLEDNDNHISEQASKWLHSILAQKYEVLFAMSDYIASLNRLQQKQFYKTASTTIRYWLIQNATQNNFKINSYNVPDNEQLYSSVLYLDEAIYHVERNSNARMQFLDISIFLKKQFA